MFCFAGGAKAHGAYGNGDRLSAQAQIREGPVPIFEKAAVLSTEESIDLRKAICFSFRYRKKSQSDEPTIHDLRSASTSDVEV